MKPGTVGNDSTAVSVVALFSAMLMACGATKSSMGPSGGESAEGGAPAGVAATRRICDGSSQIRLAFEYASGGGALPAFTSILYDLGFDFLYVDGTCHFWAQGPTLPLDEFLIWRPYHEGELSPSQEEMLHDAVGYDDFARGPIAGACGGTHSSDQDIALLWNGAEVHRCDSILNVPDNWPLRDVLFSQGAPVTGPMRIRVGVTTVSPYSPVYEWPLDEPPDQYAVASPTSFRITSAAATQALRELRERALSDWEKNPNLFSGAIVVEPPGFVRTIADETYVMSLRDELPFTNSDGLWAP